MREMICKIAGIVSVVCGIGLITSAVYASVIFVGDTENVGFKSAQKVMPAVDFTCQNGQDWYNGKCVAKCDRTTYPQAVALDETKGTIASCTDAWGTYYTYTSCHNGWDLIEGDCIETDCSNFSYTSAPESIAGTVTSCKSGLKTFYKYLSCNEGWDFANGKCGVHSCSSTTYPYTSSPSADAGTIVTCKTGVATRYGYSNCRTGWDKSSGYCNIHVCDNNTFPFTSQPSNSIGTVVSCKTGNDVKYGYSACTSDYNLVNGQCEPKCTYALTSKPTGCATVADSCEKNGTIYYDSICTACDNGYTLGNGTCTACTWNGLSLSACPRYGTCSNNTCGEITKYGLDSCSFGFDASNGSCVLHSYAVGDVFAYNGTNIGVVYRVENNGYKVRIVALSHVGPAGTVISSTVKWQNSAKDASTTNISNATTAANDMNGQSNTDQLISFSNSQSSISYKVNPALGARAYAPSACGTESFCAKGKWYLPSLGEMKAMYDNKSKMTSGVSSAGGTAFASSDGYWTSTEYNASYAWRLYWSTGARAYNSKTSSYYVRPSLQVDICEVNGTLYDSSLGECMNCDMFNLDSCPEHGVCASSDCSGSTKYKLSSCNDGYVVNGNICGINPCSGYNLESCPSTHNCNTCLSGTTTKYQWSGTCKTGYISDGSTCVVNPCDGYDLTSCPTHGSCSTCKSGTATKYRWDDCQDGYIVSGNSCTTNPCTGYDWTSCPTGHYCNTCLSGTTTKYQWSGSCQQYYSSSGNGCVCSLTATSMPEGCTKVSGSCKQNGTTYYNTYCQTCKTQGWYLSNGTCYKQTCTNCTTSPSIPHCSDIQTTYSGDDPYYWCMSCESDYYRASNTECAEKHDRTWCQNNCKAIADETVVSSTTGEPTGECSYCYTQCNFTDNPRHFFGCYF